METLQIMTKTEGHKEEHYDPSNKEQTHNIKQLIKEKLKDGYYLYGAKKGETFIVMDDPDKIDDEELERFILTKDVTKRLIAKPVIGG